MNSYSLDYIDDLYVRYIRDPESVSPGWRKYFEQFSVAADPAAQMQAAYQSEYRAEANGAATAIAEAPPIAAHDALYLARIQERVDQLVREYRVRGHLSAQLDPLGLSRTGTVELQPTAYGLTDEDLRRPIEVAELNNFAARTLGDVLQKLHNTYCRSIGAQFTHIDNRNIRDWLQRRMETTENRIQLSHEVQKRIWVRLADASIFEEFIRKKFVGAKTFSLEGAESLIPLLDLALEKAGQHGVKEVVMAMAHRGRLNVLANILKKRALNIFWSFEDPRPELSRGGGDVRYHLGYSSDWTTANGDRLHISLCFNPSHLGFVNPVALGRCRSKQDRIGDTKRTEVMTILIHGEAAFAGEGIVQETLNLSQLEGYRTGGTLHVIINNQVGFTTESDQGRSSTYATDVAKLLQVPIFHVNGEDPEAVAQVVSLAMDFRREFRRDAVIDLYCYRRWGHNEGDEPRFTQPLMYAEIDRRKSVRDNYLERLLELGQLAPQEAETIISQRQEKLEREFEASRTEPFVPDTQTLGGMWEGYVGGAEPEHDDTVTGVSRDLLTPLIQKLGEYPADFQPSKKLLRTLQQRVEMGQGQRPLDWATAEGAALATLCVEGHRVRITGQDCERGTFSHRHAVLRDSNDNRTYMPLAHLSPDQAPIEIINSPLSEAGVLGFEYGYSLDCPEGLIAWEAQFGDFWNCAQVIVDQFITSAEDKWKRLSGITLLLPHGFEGQGPEHCSARIERFMMLTAEDNIQVCQPSTPAQYFHLLRRQVLRRWRKPLMVLTPKSLLRHPAVVSPLAELEQGRFRKLLADEAIDPAAAQRVLLCSGKVYYDLLEQRQQRGLQNRVAIVRVEQLYPLRTAELMAALRDYSNGCQVWWVQEEPENMGALWSIRLRFGAALAERFRFAYVSRSESSSPSTGSLETHKLEQRELLDAALNGL